MVDRNYILNRIKTKGMTVEEFNFDKLSAPPIMSLFTAQDIYELRRIATSIRYSGKPQLKRQMIDEIMRRRGFVFFIGGTNRLTYTFIHDDSFLVKVAFDDIGMNDNPAEYRNQFIFKPFVTKVFEITPCGTLGLFERVKPITNREEFIAVADDVFILINSVFIGKYVLADIGSKFFMNYGIRDGFGVVLLDFPYIYPLDGNKLYCTAQDPTSPSGCCDGIIDYDDGFNFLVCTKCGAKYKAAELTDAEINHKVRIIKNKGDKAMVINVTGGKRNISKSINSNQFANEARSIPTTASGMKIVTLKAGQDGVPNINGNHHKKNIIKAEVKPATIPDEAKVVAEQDAVEVEEAPVVEEVVEAKVEEKVEETPVVEKKEDKPEIKKTTGNIFTSAKNIFAKEKPEVKQAIEIHNDPQEDVYGTIMDYIGEIIKLSGLIEGKQLQSVKDALINAINSVSTDPEKADIVPIDHYEATKHYIKRFTEEFESVDDDNEYREVLKDENLINFIFHYYEAKATVDHIAADGDDVKITLSFNLFYNAEDLEVASDEIFSDDIIEIEKKDIIGAEDTKKVKKSEEKKPAQNTGDFKFFKAEVTNTCALRPGTDDSNKKKVIVLRADNGDLITMGPDMNILAIDTINDRSVNSIAIVSQTWLNSTVKRLEEFDGKPTDYLEDMVPVPNGVLQQ